MAAAKRPIEARKFGTILSFAHSILEINKQGHHDRRDEKIKEAVANLKGLEENWQVHACDNRNFDWPMMDHIITDPPWPFTKKELEHYVWLEQLAQEKLKPGGFLAVQCVAYHIGQVLPIFHRFKYHITLAMVYNQACKRAAYGCHFLNNWKPILLFSKGDPTTIHDTVTDTITVKNCEMIKEYHDWQQPIKPFLKWIPALTRPGDLIGDPFVCTGTIPIACKRTGRRAICTEIDPEMVAVARMLLAKVSEED